MSNIRICVIGLGYVGLPLSRLFSTKYKTIGYDQNQERVEELTSGHDSTLEVSDEQLNEAMRTYGLVFTTYKKNYEACACIVKNGYVYVCISNHPNDADELKKHISDMIRQNGLKGMAGVFTNKDDYLKRLSDLEKKDDEDRANDEALLNLMLQLSL